MKRAVQDGLTIIELMIIVAIIGVLAAVAIPAYQDYAAGVKVREASSLANPVRAALGIACSKGNLSGMNNEALGLASADTYSGGATRSIVAAGVSASEATVTVTLNSIAGRIDDGQKIVYVGACDSGRMTWTVTGDVPPQYLPES